MCATCVAQGIGYVGTALVGLQVMGVRAKAKRQRSADTGTEPVTEPVTEADDTGVLATDGVAGEPSSAPAPPAQHAGV